MNQPEKEHSHDSRGDTGHRTHDRDLQETQSCISGGWMAGEDRAQHRGEYRDAGAVVEKALSVEDRLHSTWGTDLAQKRDDRDRIRSRDDRAEQEAAGPVDAQDEVGEHTDDADCHKNPNRGKQSDGHDATPQLLQVEVQRRLEDQARNEGEKDEVGTDRGQPEARYEADQDSAHGEEHRVWHRRCGSRDQPQNRRGGAKNDQEEKKALRCAHRGVGDPPPTRLPGTPSCGAARARPRAF